MSIITKVTFIGWFKSGEMFTKEVLSCYQVIAKKSSGLRYNLAEVNKALVKAFVNDEKVFEADFR
ncbi:discriminator of mRNA degradation [Escherichia phage OLB35]|uniref:Discriminator of mRNA degradation n=1 Tax=Escherichia phage OLB35 TaxID=2448911 RepID=A0A3G3MCT4_9CAUD|nr:discriminator of mRNA degradation [Escherichia phage OLB35]